MIPDLAAQNTHKQIVEWLGVPVVVVVHGIRFVVAPGSHHWLMNQGGPLAFKFRALPDGEEVVVFLGPGVTLISNAGGQSGENNA